MIFYHTNLQFWDHCHKACVNLEVTFGPDSVQHIPVYGNAITAAARGLTFL